MKYIFLSFLMAATLSLSAQKNLVPVSKSSLTGIILPKGSKKDSRMLSLSAARMLLEMESNKTNVTLSNPEVLALPPVSTSGFSKDSLEIKLTGLGWHITTIEGDKEYSWLRRGKSYLIAYFSADERETSLYLAEAAPAPATGNETANTIEDQPAVPRQLAQQPNPEMVKSPSAHGYVFSTTNFDDGWISAVKEDWVQVTKADITILLHFPTSRIDVSSSDYKTIANNAWNTLVAPRYTNLQNFTLFSGSADYERPYFVSGDVTENISGKKVYVVLFKRGNSGWIEIITRDKSTFIQSFGIDIGKVDYYVDSSIWDPLKKMSYYNRFAVAAGDINGKWTNNFTGIQQYVNVYTAADAGMKTHSSTEIFEFETNGTYRWELKVASGFVGSIKFEGVKSAGIMTLPNNWQIHFSDMEGKPKTYNAYFSCIKGARILWFEDNEYRTGYTGYAKSE